MAYSLESPLLLIILARDLAQLLLLLLDNHLEVCLRGRSECQPGFRCRLGWMATLLSESAPCLSVKLVDHKLAVDIGVLVFLASSSADACHVSVALDLHLGNSGC